MKLGAVLFIIGGLVATVGLAQSADELITSVKLKLIRLVISLTYLLV